MKRKMLFITFAFMFLLLIFCSNSFASTELQVDGKTFTMPDWWISKEHRLFAKVYESGNSDKYIYILVCSDSEIICGNFYFENKNKDYYYYKGIYDINATDFSNENFNNTTYSGSYSQLDFSDVAFYYSTHDVYKGDTLVFQAPPQEVEEVTLKTVLEKEKETNPQMAMKEILIILPTILVVVVSYLGLRKALAMLSAILHRS